MSTYNLSVSLQGLAVDRHVGRGAAHDAPAAHNPRNLQIKLCSQCSRCPARPYRSCTFPNLRGVADCGNGKQSAKAFIQREAGSTHQHENVGDIRRGRVRGFQELESVGSGRPRGLHESPFAVEYIEFVLDVHEIDENIFLNVAYRNHLCVCDKCIFL